MLATLIRGPAQRHVAQLAGHRHTDTSSCAGCQKATSDRWHHEVIPMFETHAELARLARIVCAQRPGSQSDKLKSKGGLLDMRFKALVGSGKDAIIEALENMITGTRP